MMNLPLLLAMLKLGLCLLADKIYSYILQLLYRVIIISHHLLTLYIHSQPAIVILHYHHTYLTTCLLYTPSLQLLYRIIIIPYYLLTLYIHSQLTYHHLLHISILKLTIHPALLEAALLYHKLLK